MGLFNNTEADVRAINDYMNRTAPKTSAAAQLKKQWVTWYSGLNGITIKLDDTFAEASNRRNAFNVAQAKNEQELEKTKQFLAQSSANDKKIRPDLYAKTDSVGNFQKAKGVTVASAAPGTVLKGSRPTIRRGSVGEAVKEWQRIIGVEADGKFGPDTDRATRAWQREHGLEVDGAVGGATWAAALGGSNAPNVPFSVAAVTPVAPAGKPASTAPTGTVAQISSMRKPKPVVVVKSSKPKPSKKAADKAAKPAIQAVPPPVLTSGLSWQSIRNLPTWGKVVLGGGLAGLIGLGIHHNRKFK